jgi:hypothetical protein
MSYHPDEVVWTETAYQDAILDNGTSSANHLMAYLNEWDIGITFKSPLIYLFKPTLGKTSGMSCYPMVNPLSRDYGSIQTFINWNDTRYKVKIYPRLVHTIKSFNSRLQGEQLATVRGIKRRAKACVQMVQRLAKVPNAEMGGFRIEVSVQAPTLDIAKRWVEGTPLLNINFWREPWGQGVEGQKIDVLLTNKESLLLNANWIIQRGYRLKHLTGRDIYKPTKIQCQVVTDILSSLGWNAGKSKPTPSLDNKAWWCGEDGEQEQQPIDLDSQVGTILSHLNQNYRGKEGTTALVSIMRNGHRLGYIPCQINNLHQYNICD